MSKNHIKLNFEIPQRMALQNNFQVWTCYHQTFKIFLLRLLIFLQIICVYLVRVLELYYQVAYCLVFLFHLLHYRLLLQIQHELRHIYEGIIRCNWFPTVCVIFIFPVNKIIYLYYLDNISK